MSKANRAGTYSRHRLTNYAPPLLLLPFAFPRSPSSMVPGSLPGTTQAISNCVWSYATTGNHAPRVFDVVARTASRRLAEEGNTQSLANTLWAYATVNVKADQMFRAVAGEGPRMAADGNVQVRIGPPNWCYLLTYERDEADNRIGTYSNAGKRLCTCID